ncbi:MULTISPECIES: FecR family protein [Stenotrophomonas]|uniref:FecR family protein n=1 Tax=Stenotrophomonas maltophilia TaxID=40324 RepID=UPI0009C0D1D2|nr:FecR domain-containing protein [Stenotrophomonas maltophilia]
MSVDNQSMVRDESIAEYWVIRLASPECDEHDHREFEDWLAAHPENPRSYARVQNIHLSVRALASDEFLRAELRRARKASATSRRPKFVWQAGLAAALVVMVILPVWWKLAPDAPVINYYASGIGEIKRATLQDGSHVEIDTGTKIIARFDKSTRSIEVVSGRVQVDAAKDPRPLVVSVGDFTVRDVGTIFSIRNESGVVEISLLEGLVAIEEHSAPGAITELAPGQIFRQDSEGNVTVSRGGIEQMRLWTSGVTEMKNQPLQDLVAELNRYSVRKIRLPDERDGQVLVSGRYRTMDQADALKLLEGGLGFQVDRSDPSYIILRRRQ